MRLLQPVSRYYYPHTSSVENKENLSQDNQQLGLDLNCVTLKYNVVKGQ